jgi:hypothetical protein
MTPDDIEQMIERAADRTAEKIREEIRGVLTSLGFDMDNLHEEQQVIAFARKMYDGTKGSLKAIRNGALVSITTALVGWAVWFFTGRPHQ